MVKSVQIVLISAGVLVICLLVKCCDYEALNLLWSSLDSYLRPPYLYLIINFIIITIAASSRFHQDKRNEEYEDVRVSTAEVGFGGVESRVEIVSSIHDNNVPEDKSSNSSVEDELVIWKSSRTPPRERSVSPEPAEKPLVSARFAHRKPLRPTPEGGRALRVSKPKRHETLENTWKAITEGKAMPLTRHLKKCDSWENPLRQENVDPAAVVKKSETFKDRTNYYNSPDPPSGRLRKEPSLSQDELNRRVEAFINKFNEEMRLQRQESLNQYKEMVGGGVY